MNGRALQILLFSGALLLLPAAAAGDSDSEYQQLRLDYLKLMRLDPKIKKPERWERTADDLTAFFNRHASADHAARSAFLLGRLHEYLYRRTDDERSLGRSLYFYQRLSSDYPGHPLADDALLFYGDLQRDARSGGEAEAAYRRIVLEYPDGDQYKKARDRLGLAPDQTPAPQRAVGVEKPERSAEQERPAEKPGFFSRLFRIDGEQEPSGKPAAAGAGEQEPLVEEGLQPLPIAARFPRRPVIVIDPGHGGEEEGAHGVEGTFEKDIVLNISLMLDELFRKQLRAKTVLTRVRDVTVDLAERTQIANDNEADIFISVHANASVSKRAAGIETYYLDNTNDRSSLRLAKRENASFSRNLDDLGFMLSDLIQNAKLDDSISLAHYIQDSLYKGISTVYPDAKNLGVKKAPFYVLVGAHMPCVLVEVSFIDHRIEGQRLITRQYQRLAAESIFDGVLEYFKNIWNL